MRATLLASLVTASLHMRLDRRSVVYGAGSTLGAAVACTVASPPTLAQAISQAPSYTWQNIPGMGLSSRSYAFVSLANGMRGVICSDPTSRRCEIAVAVRCGSLDDPPELEGLAHLAEHVTLACDEQLKDGLCVAGSRPQRLRGRARPCARARPRPLYRLPRLAVIASLMRSDKVTPTPSRQSDARPSTPASICRSASHGRHLPPSPKQPSPRPTGTMWGRLPIALPC